MMADEQNFHLESTRIKIPESSKNSDEGLVESVRLDLEDSLMIDDREQTSSPPRSLELKDKLSGLNSKLSTYVADKKKTESLLADSLRKCKRLEEANTMQKADSHQQLEFLRSQLEDQVQKTVLAEDQRDEIRQRLESCLKQSDQISSELETYRERVGELEENLHNERRRSKDALGELVLLREQMLQERTEYNEQKQQMMNLKIDHAKLQEHFKINSAELTFSQSRLGELQNHAQYSSEDVQNKLAELRQRLEKKFSERMAEKLREKQTEITRLQDELQETLSKVLRTKVSNEDFELLRTQLEEQRRRTESAEAEATEWRERFHEAENKLERAEIDHAKLLDEERRRRKELNRRLLAQSRAQDEVRQELETYRRLIEGLDPDGSNLAECLSIATPEAVASSPRAGSPLGRLQMFEETLNSPEARTRLLRRALTPKKRSFTGDTESFIQVLNSGRIRSHET